MKPVTIIGAGPAGLSLAVSLARQGIEVLIIEEKSSTTNHPKARGINVRTMELFRLWGDLSLLLQHQRSQEARRFIWVDSLQGNEVIRIAAEEAQSDISSPTQSTLISQDKVEEWLLDILKKYPNVKILFSTEFISLKQVSSHVIIQVKDFITNQLKFIETRFLIAADGVHSSIRQQLGIPMEGRDNLGCFCSIYCEMDLSSYTKNRPCIGFFFNSPKFIGYSLISVDGDNRWIVMIRYNPQEIKKEIFSDEYCIQEIQKLVNISNIEISILNKSFWQMGAQIAANYRQDRVFLVGDAAHQLPPTGGLGMNTAIQDAHNLGYKLGLVMNHGVSEEILDTFYEERAPVAKKYLEWSQSNAQRLNEIYKAIYLQDEDTLKNKLTEQSQHLNHRGLDLGFTYSSNSIIQENATNHVLNPETYLPNTLPGSRAPHLKLIKNGKEISTLDLFDNYFVLLIGSDGHAWQMAATNLIQQDNYPMVAYRIAVDGDLQDPFDEWHECYEVSKTGVVLIRPDGHVAWRSQTAVEEPELVLSDILNKLFMKGKKKVELKNIVSTSDYTYFYKEEKNTQSNSVGPKVISKYSPK